VPDEADVAAAPDQSDDRARISSGHAGHAALELQPVELEERQHARLAAACNALQLVLDLVGERRRASAPVMDPGRARRETDAVRAPPRNRAMSCRRAAPRRRRWSVFERGDCEVSASRGVTTTTGTPSPPARDRIWSIS
jgi:hypothetical protein